VEGWDAQGLKALATGITARPGHVAILLSAATPPLMVIARTARSMKDLVNDLLDLASIQAGKLSLSAGPTPLASLVEEARDMHESAARAAGLRLTADDIPHVDVFADRARVLQVLSNLLGNAIKFTPSGGTIAVRATATDAEVTISVVDNGRGIPAQDLATVFEPYRARGSGAGSGLGLFIAQGIVEGHDGRIWIDSREHAGRIRQTVGQRHNLELYLAGLR